MVFARRSATIRVPTRSRRRAAGPTRRRRHAGPARHREPDGGRGDERRARLGGDGHAPAAEGAEERDEGHADHERERLPGDDPAERATSLGRGHVVGDGREHRSHEAAAADAGEKLPQDGGAVAVAEGEAEPRHAEREHGGDEHRPPADAVGGRPGRDRHHAPADAHHRDQVRHGGQGRAEIAGDVEEERREGDRRSRHEERHDRERREHAPRQRRRRRGARTSGEREPLTPGASVGITRSIVPSRRRGRRMRGGRTSARRVVRSAS